MTDKISETDVRTSLGIDNIKSQAARIVSDTETLKTKNDEDEANLKRIEEDKKQKEQDLLTLQQTVNSRQAYLDGLLKAKNLK